MTKICWSLSAVRGKASPRHFPSNVVDTHLTPPRRLFFSQPSCGEIKFMVTVLDLFDNHKTTFLTAEQRSKYCGLLQVRMLRRLLGFYFLLHPDVLVIMAKSLRTIHSLRQHSPTAVHQFRWRSSARAVLRPKITMARATPLWWWSSATLAYGQKLSKAI